MALVAINIVADYLDLKTPTIYEWARTGKIPCYKINGALRFKMDEVRDMVEESRYVPTNVRVEPLKSLEKKEVNSIIDKSIAEYKPKRYDRPYGKPGHIRGLRKETDNGTV